MSRRTGLFSLAALLAAALPAAAAPDVLDLVPEDAAVGVVVRNISDLKKKSDKFYESAGIKDEMINPDLIPRPAVLFDLLCEFLDIKAGIDEDAPAALILLNPKGAPLHDIPLVLAMPVKDRDKIAGNCNRKGEELKDGKIFERERKRFDPFSHYCAHNKHLLVGSSEKSLETYLKSEKSIVKVLSADQRKSLADADA